MTRVRTTHRATTLRRLVFRTQSQTRKHNAETNSHLINLPAIGSTHWTLRVSFHMGGCPAPSFYFISAFCSAQSGGVQSLCPRVPVARTWRVWSSVTHIVKRSPLAGGLGVCVWPCVTHIVKQSPLAGVTVGLGVCVCVCVWPSVTHIVKQSPLAGVTVSAAAVCTCYKCQTVHPRCLARGESLPWRRLSLPAGGLSA